MTFGPAQTMRRYNNVYINVGFGESTSNHPLVLSSKKQIITFDDIFCIYLKYIIYFLNIYPQNITIFIKKIFMLYIYVI